jgi:hypothetical protein
MLSNDDPMQLNDAPTLLNADLMQLNEIQR